MTASPRRTCRCLVALAVWMLPAAQRARYAEEFSDELLELRHDEQLGYALRLLGRSWSLCHVLNDSLRKSRVPRPRRIPVLATVAAVLVIAFSGVGSDARTAEPGDRLWTLTKVLYTDVAESKEAAVTAQARLKQVSDLLAQGRVGEALIMLERVQDELPAVDDEESRTELQKDAGKLRDELGDQGGTDDGAGATSSGDSESAREQEEPPMSAEPPITPEDPPTEEPPVSSTPGPPDPDSPANPGRGRGGTGGGGSTPTPRYAPPPGPAAPAPPEAAGPVTPAPPESSPES